MLGFFRHKRNQPGIRYLLLCLITVWLVSALHAPCSMPSLSYAASALKHPLEAIQDQGVDLNSPAEHPCAVDPCLTMATDGANLSSAGLAAFFSFHWLYGLIAFTLALLIPSPLKITRPSDYPRLARRIPLIYRYCTLLN